MVSSTGRETVTAGIQRSTEGVLRYAVCGFDSLMIFMTNSGHFLCDSFACWKCSHDIFGTELLFHSLSD